MHGGPRTWDHMVKPLHPSEVLECFERLRSENDTMNFPIEGYWFHDAYLLTSLVDGVPESPEHCSYQRRISTRWITFCSIPRSYLDNPNWESDIYEHDARLRCEGRGILEDYHP